MVDLGKIKQLYNFSKQLSFSDANELISAAQSNSFTKKEIIIEEGSKMNTVYFVRSGMIRKYFINEKGEEIGIEGSIKIIENNFNSDLKKQLRDVTTETINTAQNNSLSDDLTLVAIGK